MRAYVLKQDLAHTDVQGDGSVLPGCRIPLTMGCFEDSSVGTGALSPQLLARCTRRFSTRAITTVNFSDVTLNSH